MKNLRLLLLPAVLAVATACKKDAETATPAAPTKTALLTAVTWRESSSSLVINGTEGTQATAAGSADSYKFGTDGKVAITPASGPATAGTWALTGNDTQLVITPASGPAQTFQVYTLTANSLSFGVAYTQAQIQASLAGQPVAGVPNGLITLLLLSAGGYTFPAGTPAINANQLTSLQTRTNLVPR